MRAYLSHHERRRHPGHLVGLGRVEVGAAAEEESGEGDEDEGEQGGPHHPGALRAFGLLRQQVQHGVDYEAHECDEPQHVEQRAADGGLEQVEHRRGDAKGYDVDYPSLFFPPFVDEDADAVEAAPGDEVERRTVPQAAEEHGVHVVDVGAQLAAVAGAQEVKEHHAEHYGGGHRREGGVAQAEGGDGEDGGEDEVGEEAGMAVAAEGYVEVVAQPVGERHVPAAPEVGGIGGFVGRVEVGGQVEAHHHGHADGYVGVAREVGIDLHGV